MGQALATVIPTTRLPKDEKIKILLKYSQCGSLEYRICFLDVLADFEPQKSRSILLETLKTLPKDATIPYAHCPEARLLRLVMKLYSKELCSAYLEAAKRANVGLRLQMISMDCCCSKTYKDRKIAFLKHFWDDSTLRTIPSGKNKGLYRGSCAASNVPKISVGNYAVVQIAHILKMRCEPEFFWTDAQWNGLRSAVKERLEKQRPRLPTKYQRTKG